MHGKKLRAVLRRWRADGGVWVAEHVTPTPTWPPALSPLQYRWHVFKSIRGAIDANEGGLDKFTQGEWGG